MFVFRASLLSRLKLQGLHRNAQVLRRKGFVGGFSVDWNLGAGV